MKPETLRALKGSIAKWDLIAHGLKYDFGNINCPLCNLFYHEACQGCPVSKLVGSIYCTSTPYIQYIQYRFTPAEYDAVEAEIEFLIGLLPSSAAEDYELKQELK